MKKIAVISGKGGTGKTMLSASFAALAGSRVIADCDVDAANMHLMLGPEIKEKHVFKAGKKAYTDRGKCTACGKCAEVCRFDAIKPGFTIDELSCEGCGFCASVCPAGAIAMKESVAGEWYESATKYGPFVHAKLGIAEDNSGKLVSKVRAVAEEKALKTGAKTLIIDGPPGTGCPVMSAVTGADFAVIVTEPTVSGIHDLSRVAGVAGHFKVPAGVIVNKHDINEKNTLAIEKYCADNGLAFLGKVSFSGCVVDAINAGVPPVMHCGEKERNEIENCWNNALKYAGL